MSGKTRWSVEYQFNDGQTFTDFVKIAARPVSPNSEDWNTINITHFTSDPNYMKPVWDYLSSTWQLIENKIEFPENQAITINLQLICSKRCPACWSIIHEYEPIEEWILKNAYPQSINFGELDHSNSEECQIEITWRYKTAEYLLLSTLERSLMNNVNSMPPVPPLVKSDHTQNANDHPPYIGLGPLGGGNQPHHPMCQKNNPTG